MLNLNTVKADIEHWIVNFVEVPDPALNGWPPCPYARKARLERDYDVRLGLSPMHDLLDLAQAGLGGKSVVLLVYEPEFVSHEELDTAIFMANQKHLIPKDLIALEDHPNDPEIVNGISMNQGQYAMALVQSLSDLNAKARVMAAKGFYESWPEEYLETLFQNREDPRK
jgi:hypothetical protein